jgi:hypothetical protein
VWIELEKPTQYQIEVVILSQLPRWRRQVEEHLIQLRLLPRQLELVDVLVGRLVVNVALVLRCQLWENLQNFDDLVT